MERVRQIFHALRPAFMSGSQTLQLRVIFLAMTALVVIGIAMLLPLVKGLSFIGILAAGLVYLASHFLRAVRLAYLSIDLFGVSGRTAALMHLATAPVAFALPFKSGELIRLHELWKLGGTLLYAIVALLVDRMYDSVFLLPLAIVLLIGGNAAPVFVALTLLAAVLPLTVIVIGPRLLADIQRYMVRNHNHPRILDVLQQVDAARALVLRSADVAWRRMPELCVISLLIWLCELFFCLILIANFQPGIAAPVGSVLDLLGARLSMWWWDIGANTLPQMAMAISLISLLVIWPFAMTMYVMRRGHEPRRALSEQSLKRLGNGT